MNQRHKLRLSVLVAALATTAVFAGTYATIESTSETTTTPYNATVITEKETLVATPEQTIVTSEPARIAEPVIEPAPVLAAPVPAAPVRTSAPAEPPITITEQRLTLDERIQADVMDALARNPTLSGKIGVESKDAVVTLSGYTLTSGQAMRAGRDARGVIGVRYVVNEIRPRVGAVTY